MSTEYTAAAANLLPVAIHKAGHDAHRNQVIDQFWRLYDLADGLGDVMSWIATAGEYHPIRVPDARIVSMSSFEEGGVLKWVEKHRDGSESESEANLGTLRNPAIGAVYDTACKLAGTDQRCSLVVCYEPNTDGWETMGPNGKKIRPDVFRRVGRLTPHFVSRQSQQRPTPAAQTSAPPDPARPAQAPPTAPTVPSEPPTQPPAAEQPALTPAPAYEAPTAAGSSFDRVLLPLIDPADWIDPTRQVTPEVRSAYRLWLGGADGPGAEGQNQIRKLNKQARDAGASHVPALHTPATMEHLHLICRWAAEVAAAGVPA